MFIKIIEKIRIIHQSSFFKKMVIFASGSMTVIEIQNSFLTANNSNLKISNRIVSVIRGSCSTGAFLTSYFARKSTSPRLEAIFKICCVIFAFGYGICGGDFPTILTYIHTATKSW
jgi:hydroxyethylthiazole kinase-like sugar kinase family protein